MMEEQERSQKQEEVDIESIMREVRAELLRQTRTQEVGLQADLGPPSLGDPADLQVHLYQARLSHQVAKRIKLEWKQVDLPILGPLLTRIRRMLHELAFHYVFSLALEQEAFNRQVVDALALLAGQMENEKESDRGGAKSEAHLGE